LFASHPAGKIAGLRWYLSLSASYVRRAQLRAWATLDFELPTAARNRTTGGKGSDKFQILFAGF
jgi:hypothetical protein